MRWLLSLAILFESAALAEEVPPLASPQRIPWAMRCAGPMPPLLIASLAAICVLIAAAVIYYRRVVRRHGR